MKGGWVRSGIGGPVLSGAFGVFEVARWRR